MGSYKVISPGASPQTGPQFSSQQQQQQQQQLQAPQLLYQQPAEDQPLPAAGFSPSLQPQYQQSHYPSPDSPATLKREKRSPDIIKSPPPLGKSLKSPRILPSRRGVTPPSKSYRATGRAGRDAEVGAPDLGAQMDLSTNYITPPHYPQGVEFTLDGLNSVEMPLASFSDLPSAYYTTSTSPQSPPPTPLLPAYESNETLEVSTDMSSLYAAATPMDFLCNPALVTAPAPILTTLYGDEDGEGSDEEDRNEDDGADTAGGEGANDEDAKSRRARNPKTPHKVSEKRRRELFKTHFDELTALLPPLPNPPPPPPKPPRPVEPGKRKRTPKPPVPKPPNRIQMLHHAMDYVQRLEDDHQRALEEIGRLMALLQ
ncbi:hypothetical protein BDZ88DRAFT_403748 [Geranomyces variabilis]|nr:hypothetical protein BDZ88DRAFT_403748 [Geranomyces variabilis]